MRCQGVLTVRDEKSGLKGEGEGGLAGLTACRVKEWTHSHISLCQVSLGWGRRVEMEQREERKIWQQRKRQLAADESKESLMRD